MISYQRSIVLKKWMLWLANLKSRTRIPKKGAKRWLMICRNQNLKNYSPILPPKLFMVQPKFKDLYGKTMLVSILFRVAWKVMLWNKSLKITSALCSNFLLFISPRVSIIRRMEFLAFLLTSQIRSKSFTICGPWKIIRLLIMPWSALVFPNLIRVIHHMHCLVVIIRPKLWVVRLDWRLLWIFRIG